MIFRTAAFLLLMTLLETTSVLAQGLPLVHPPKSHTVVAHHLPGQITWINIQRAPGATASAGSDVPVTFGQVFAEGDLPKSAMLTASLEDGTPVKLQVDAKARHSDGSLRHAVITALVPLGRSGKTRLLLLNGGAATLPPAPTVTAASVADGGLTAEVHLVVDGKTYTASAQELLRSVHSPMMWLSGPLVNEWELSAPLKTAQGQVHPHLAARFAIRSYTGKGSASIDVSIENDWAFAPAPQNITYDVNILVGAHSMYTKTGLKHFHHARWHKVFWWGNHPDVQLEHDTAYLIASRAVPNYDQTIHISESSLTEMGKRFSGAAAEPMGNGLATPYMPTTGGRNDIGLLPGWAVSYLLSMNQVAKKATLGTADMAGSWSMHYRNPKTDKPVSLIDFPYMTIVGHDSDTINPGTKKSEAFPPCGGDCVSPYTADSAHAPAMAYLPYLVTGDYYYLEELQFWTMYDLFQSNPGYRAAGKGLFHQNQVRAQAWALRDLSDAAYITPDADPFKKQFVQFLSDNLDWYNGSYQPRGSQPNIFGALVDASAREYKDHSAISPWQDDFFTAAVGRTVELGFDKAKPLLLWKAQFPIKRMTDPDYCWIVATVYEFKVSDQAGGPVYTAMSNAYLGSNPKDMTALACGSSAMAANLKLKVGEMVGYSDTPGGFPSNMQPALALSFHSGAPGASAAWQRFAARSVKPDYSGAPQFAIIPRAAN